MWGVLDVKIRVVRRRISASSTRPTITCHTPRAIEGIDVQFCLLLYFRSMLRNCSSRCHATPNRARAFFFAFFILVVGMTLAVVDVVAHLTQGFDILEDVLDVDMISRHNFNFVQSHCSLRPILVHTVGASCPFLGKHKRHGQTNAGRRLKNQVGFI